MTCLPMERSTTALKGIILGKSQSPAWKGLQLWREDTERNYNTGVSSKK